MIPVSEFRRERDIRLALSADSLKEFEDSKSLREYVESIYKCAFVNYNKDLSMFKYSYLCRAILDALACEGDKVRVKADNYASRTVTFDLIKDAVLCYTNKTPLKDLVGEYSAEEVFKMSLPYNKYLLSLDTLKDNLEILEKRQDKLRISKAFGVVFENVNVPVVADMSSEEMEEYLCTCGLPEVTKDLVWALHTAAISMGSKENTEYAIEDIFVKQEPVIDDTRISIDDRMYFGMLQLLSTDEDYASQLLAI